MNDASTTAFWVEKLQKAERCHKEFREAARASEEDYFDKRSDSRKLLFNVHYSTVNTLHARLYSKPPVPDVRRRFNTPGDPMAAAGKQAAQMVERALSYTLDSSQFDANAHRIVDDFLIAGCGVPWVEYDAKVSESDGGPAIELQTVSLRHVPWSRFHWEPGKDWEDVDWVARDHYLTAAEIKAQFDRDPPDAGGGSKSKDESRSDAQKGYATTYRVTEVWYRPKRMIYVIGWDFDEPLEVRKDALNLQGFYPCPRPMLANLKGHALEPRPDHAFFAESYDYLNRLVARIHALTAQVKAVGFYDAQLGELGSLSSAIDGTLVPVANLAERLSTAGGAAVFDRVIATLPIAEKVQVLRELQQLLATEKQRLDEQTGIADVVLGATDANETATAQSIKNNWANLRLARKTGEVARALRDVFRLMAEIMAEHFTPQSLFLMSGMQVGPEVLQLVKSDVGRNLAIDVETDSTVALDDEAEKSQRLEFLNYVAPFVQQIVPLITAQQLPADAGIAMLRFAIGSFKHGRELEEAIDAIPGTGQQLQQATQTAQQWQQQGQQLQQQAQQMQAQLQQMAGELQKAQQALQAEKAKVDPMAGQIDMAKLQIEREKLQLDALKLRQQDQQAQQKHALEVAKLQIDALAKQSSESQPVEASAGNDDSTAAQTAILETIAALQATVQAMAEQHATEAANAVNKRIAVQRDAQGRMVGATVTGAESWQ